MQDLLHEIYANPDDALRIDSCSFQCSHDGSLQAGKIVRRILTSKIVIGGVQNHTLITRGVVVNLRPHDGAVRYIYDHGAN